MVKKYTQRLPVTPEQVSAQKHLYDRSIAAMTSGLPNTSMRRPPRPAVFAGVAVVAMLCTVNFLQSRMDPSTDQGAADIMITSDGGLYVTHQEEGGPELLHPALNLASARLIADSAAAASVVDPEQLEGMARGFPLGIPSGPNNLNAHRATDGDATWGVCTFTDRRANLSLVDASSLRQVVVAGEGAFTDATELDGAAATLVYPDSDPSARYLIFDNVIAPISPSDYATMSALGITESDMSAAVQVSDSLINSLPAKPGLSAPVLSGAGQPSEEVPSRRIGDVLATTGADDTRRYWAVLRDGIQPIPLPVAELLTGGGATVTPLTDADTIAGATQVGHIDLSAYPSVMPEISAQASVCAVWEKDKPIQPSQPSTAAPTITAITSGSVPITEDLGSSAVTHDEVVTGVEMAQQFASTPGKGWYVRITGDGENSEAEGQIAYIDDTGIRYDLVPVDGDYTPVAQALGLTGLPVPIPDSMAALLVRGPDLSFDAAKVAHPDGTVGVISQPAEAPLVSTEHGGVSDSSGAPFIGMRGEGVTRREDAGDTSDDSDDSAQPTESEGPAMTATADPDAPADQSMR